MPVTIEQGEANGLAALGDRYRWVVYPAVDHVIYELADSFADAAAYMGDAQRVRNPGNFSFTLGTHRTAERLSGNQITSGGISWTQLPKSASARPATTGCGTSPRDHTRTTRRIERVLRRAPDAAASITHSAQGIAVDGPGPGHRVSTLTWTRGKRPAPRPVITLLLTNVRSLTVLLHAGGFQTGQRGTLQVTTDGTTTLHLGGRTVHLSKGPTTVRFIA